MEGKFTDQKYLSISSLQTDYLNLDSISGYGKDSEREIFPRQIAPFFEVPTIKKVQKVKSKSSCGWRFGQQTCGTHASYMF